MKKYLLPLLGFLFVFFSMPKLLALPVSLRLFAQINAFTHWEGRWFMYLTGTIEMVNGLLFVAAWAHSRGKLSLPQGRYLKPLAALMGVGTMAGALFTELIIRPGQDLVLTLLAPTLALACLWILNDWRNNLGTTAE